MGRGWGVGRVMGRDDGECGGGRVMERMEGGARVGSVGWG